MNTRRHTLTALTLTALLAGCGGPRNAMNVTPSSVMPNVAQFSHGTSWMLPEATSEDLVYTSDNRQTAYAYSYPDGKQVGEISGLASPIYDCSDKHGNVFFSDTSSTSNPGLVEYAHGGTQPIAVFSVPSAGACSVDPTTGNLAVSPFLGKTIYIYAKANSKSTPMQYTDTNIYYINDITYDASGNLFLDGSLTSRDPFLMTLPAGANAFERITVPYSAYDGTFEPIVWDGKHISVESEDAQKRTILNRLAISGSVAKVVGTVTLGFQAGGTHPQTAVIAGSAIQPSDKNQASHLDFYTFPRGHRTNRIAVNKDDYLWGVAFSVAPSRMRIR